MDYVGIAKTLSKFALTLGIGSIVSNAIKSTTSVNAGIFEKVCVGVTSFVLIGVVNDATKKELEEQTDEAIDTFASLKLK